jgi:hypothetical protein
MQTKLSLKVFSLSNSVHPRSLYMHICIYLLLSCHLEENEVDVFCTREACQNGSALKSFWIGGIMLEGISESRLTC